MQHSHAKEINNKISNSVLNSTRDQSLDDIRQEEPYVELAEFCKKLLTNTEQFELARVYNILGKLKNALRFRMLPIEYLFIEDEQELRGKSIKSMNIAIPAFQRKVKDMKIQGMKSREIEVISYFLSSLDNEGSRCISFNTISSYFRRIDLRYQYHHLVDYKAIYGEIAKILSKKEEFQRKWKKICKKELIGFAEMRILLNYFGIDEDVIDLILLKFIDSETSNILFFNRIESFY